jgi:hypothetical protein
MDKEFNLTLNEQEINALFNALIERPFKEVAPVVAKVQEAYKAGEEE